MISTILPVTHRILIVDDNENIHADFKKILGFSEDHETNYKLNRLESDLFGDDSEPLAEVNNAEFVPFGPQTTQGQYEFEFAQQGQIALKLVEESLKTQKHFSLAFVDMRMPPGWDGLETIQRIWAVAPDIEVVICTAFADHSLSEIRSRLGRTDRLLFLRKPFDVVSVQQIAAAMTRKNELFRENLDHVLKLESQVQEKVEELERERALNWNRVKMGYLGNMAGGVAHEIKNPLTIIQGHSDRMLGMIRQKNMDPHEFLTSISKIETSTNRIVNIIDSMMNLAKPDEATTDVLCDLKIAAQMSIDLCSEWAKSFSIDLRIDFPNTLPLAKCAPTEAQQIVSNLLSNAIDATREVKNSWITIRLSQSASSVFICVENSGPAIPETIVDKIFDPFFSTKQLGQGIGLGLSVLKSIVDLRGGKVRLNQVPHTSFLVELPIK